jgi:hypothetical protein
MEIATTPDIYVPSVDCQGNYVDKIPIIKNGIYCPCGSRKDKIYENANKLSVHTKTKIHQKWLSYLNDNKANYYIEMMKCKEVTENQQKIIVRLEHELQKKMLTIDCLTEQLMYYQKPSQPIEHIELNLLDL